MSPGKSTVHIMNLFRTPDELMFLNEVFTAGRKAMSTENATIVKEMLKECPPPGLLLHGIEGEKWKPLNGRPTAIESFDFDRTGTGSRF